MTTTPEARIALAQDLMAQSRVYEAIAQLEELVAEDPRHFQGYLNLGMIHLKLGVITRGREFMKLALACAPSEQDRHKIALILREQDDLDKRRFYRPDFAALSKSRE